MEYEMDGGGGGRERARGAANAAGYGPGGPGGYYGGGGAPRPVASPPPPPADAWRRTAPPERREGGGGEGGGGDDAYIHINVNNITNTFICYLLKHTQKKTCVLMKTTPTKKSRWLMCYWERIISHFSPSTTFGGYAICTLFHVISCTSQIPVFF